MLIYVFIDIPLKDKIMTSKYTKVNFDFKNLPWLTSPRKQLELKGVALGLINLPPDEGYTFTHSHGKQEEVYIIISGTGFIQIDNELINISRGDAIRVESGARRALKANGDGLFVICAGGIPMDFPKNPNARYLIDDGIPHYDDIPKWYRGQAGVMEKNRKLKERMIKSQKNKEE